MSRVGFFAVAGTTYRIAVDGYDGFVGTALLRWSRELVSFADWATGWGLTGAAAAPAADPEGDGLPNAVECVVGGNPAAFDAALRPAATVIGGDLVFTFSRDDASETSGVAVTVESGSALASWLDAFSVGPTSLTSSPGVCVSENGRAPDTIAVTLPLGAGTDLFARLQATAIP